jgi:N-sulfoglucosamine sulfohydrolase
MKKIIPCLVVLSGIQSAIGNQQSAMGRPNILLITTDDQGLDVGCYGNPLARTPNLDQLAKEGVRFTRAYVTQASCSPSRSSILTGLYPHQNGQVGLVNDYSMHAGTETLPAMLKKAGYRTGIIGKLHVNPESAFPFDFWEIKSPVQTRYVRKVNTAAQKFIDAAGKEPFFLMVNFFDPHDPYDALANQCDGLPKNPYKPEDIRPMDFIGIDVPELRKDIAIYYNCIERADAGIGMLMKTLKDRGLDETTLVVFLSDNGPQFTRGKVSSYEAGLHVPLIARWPGGKAGQVRNELISAIDIVPTILEVTGAQTKNVLSGTSLIPLLEGKSVVWRDTLSAGYTAHRKEHYYPSRSIRNDRYKLIHTLLPERINPLSGMGAVIALDASAPVKSGAIYNVLNPQFYQDESRFFGGSAESIRSAYATYRQPPEFQLYDLQNDPHERINLAGNPEYAPVLASLKMDLKTWQTETKDPFAESAYLQDFTRKTDELCEKGKQK